MTIYSSRTSVEELQDKHDEAEALDPDFCSHALLAVDTIMTSWAP